jgi:hypothetical protein
MILAYSVEIYRSAAWKDISDAVIAISPIPWIYRNRDYTPIVNPIKISLSSSSAYSPFVYDDLIQVKSGATVIWSGYIDEAIYSGTSRSYECIVDNDLLLLNRYIIENGTITLAAGAFQYTAPRINLMYLMKQMFTAAGLTLSTAAIDAETFYTHYYTANVAVPYNRLMIDENELYVLNQSSSAVYTTMDGETSFNSGKITFWRFIQAICGHLRLGIFITANRTYKLAVKTSNFTISDATKYLYNSKTEKAKYDDVSLDVLTTTEAVAAGAVVTDMTRTSNEGKSTETVTMLNGLSIRTYDHDGSWVSNASGQTLDPRLSKDMPCAGLTMYSPVIAQLDSKNLIYQREEIVTTATLTENTVIENSLDIVSETSRIIQETYELGDELLQNGSMENNSNWTNYDTPATNERSTTQKHSSAYSRKIVSDTGDEGATGAEFSVVSGSVYRISAWMYDDALRGGIIEDTNGRLNFAYTSSTNGEWEQFTSDITAGSTGTEQIRIINEAESATTYFDDISVREVLL